MTQDYKTTLNLPSTAFPMKAGLAQREPQRLKQWEDKDLYHHLQRSMADRPTFVLHDGPPYANGALHTGHAVNKILKDMVVKSRMVDGYRSPYVPGWDCHGLPIELQVEKKVGKVGAKVDARTFRQKCREYAARQIDIQRAGFIRMGVIGDWQNPYRTLDFTFEADMVRALAKIVENGHVVKGAKPVHWCFDCGSALAEAEIEYQDKVSPAIDVAFDAVQADAVGNAFGVDVGAQSVAVVIWTTTPWTLPANQAVALNEELEYGLYEGPNGLLVLATELAEASLGRYGVTPKRLATVAGAALEGVMLKHPFYDRIVPIVLGEHVTTEAGTGAVHTAPGHGQEDFEMGLKYGLEVLNPVGPRGLFVEGTEFFAGQHVWKSNDTVVEKLRETGTLLNAEPYEHSYPHCWRHKTPTAFRVTPQWFISMDENGLRDAALKSIQQVRWVPDWGQRRIESMVSGRPDWCISRQRTWGVPITLFVHCATGDLHPDTPSLMAKAADLIEAKGVDAWYDLDMTEWLGGDASDYERVTDILDVWFDSGVTHHGVLDRREELGGAPADIYLEGSDQHRGWFQSSLLTGVAINGQAPYRQVLTHGFTVDANGHKMSKSLGNDEGPEKIMNRLGADVLRLWVAAADYRNEMAVSEEILKRVSDAYRRIRNTARFLLGNLNGFDPATDQIPTSQCIALDVWAVNQAATLQEEIKQAYDDYQFHQVYQKVHHFCSVTMGAFYLDIIKDRLYTMPEGSAGRRSAQTAMYAILEGLVRWITPILSFTAEEIWEHMPGDRSDTVFLATWYPFAEAGETDLYDAFWSQVMALRNAVGPELEVLRKAKTIGSSLAAEIDLYVDSDLHASLSRIGDELRFALLTSEARLHEGQAPADAIEVSVDGKPAFVTVTPSQEAKCERCWHYRIDVGSDPDHPSICLRCVENLTPEGESRAYA